MDNLILQNQEKCLLISDGFDEAGRGSREAVNTLFAGNIYSGKLLLVSPMIRQTLNG
jgi:hypothetical protein